MSTVSSTSSSSRIRITGLSSGIDVDSIVEKTMLAEKTKLNQLKQKQQLAEWKQEAYREVISQVNSFADKYFNITSSSSIMKKSNFQKFKTSSSDDAVTVTAGTTAVKGTHTIEVSQIATAATQTGSGRLSKDIQGSSEADFSDLAGKSFGINLDGTEKTVTLDSSVTDLESLQTVIDNAVGEGKVVVDTDQESGVLTVTAAEDSGVQKITLSSGSSDALDSLGFDGDAVLTNRIDTSDTLETIADGLSSSLTFNSDGEIEFSINGQSFSFDKSETLDDLMSEVNKSSAGVTMKYDELADKLVITSNQLGAGKTIAVTETGGNFLNVAFDQFNEGLDAKLSIDGQSLTRSSNSITLEGITYTLNNTTTEKATVTIAQDTDAIYENISNSITDYNALIGVINSKISEEYDYDYQPLTDDQREEMEDSDITNWETKAKTGILANDSSLQDMLDKLRAAFVESVSGQSLLLSEIGIKTSSYDEKGELHIDEDTLKQALEEDPVAIMNLFAQESTSYSGTSTVRSLNINERNTRYQEEGIAYRFYDILQDNISILRDSGGNKGLLLEKAGMEGDTSDTDNNLTKLLEDYEERIAKEEDRLDEFEEDLYTKYTALETYISKMNTQLSALSSYFSES